MLNTLLILLFIRPFISSSSFTWINSAYSTILLATLLCWIISNGLPVKEIKPVKYPLLLFILALILSTFFSFNKPASMKEFYKYILAILIFLAGASLSGENKYRAIRAVVFAGFIVSILALYQYFFGFSHLTDYVAKKSITDPFVLDYIASKRIFFPFITPNALAGYLILISILVLTIKGKEKWLILTAIFLAILLTKSLGAVLSLLCGACLYVYLRKDFSIRKFAVLGILAIVFIFIFFMRQVLSKEHLAPAFSMANRLNYWQGALNIIKTHPFKGMGLGNFNLLNSRYAHNSYLQITAEMGILGLASFLWLITAVLKNQRNAVLTAAILIFLLHNLVDFTFFLPEISLIWWLILGMALKNNAIEKSYEKAGYEHAAPHITNPLGSNVGDQQPG